MTTVQLDAYILRICTLATIGRISMDLGQWLILHTYDTWPVQRAMRISIRKCLQSAGEAKRSGVSRGDTKERPVPGYQITGRFPSGISKMPPDIDSA